MFMKSIDFNFGNLVSSSDDLTTEPQTEATTSPVVMEGQSEIVLVCYDTENNVSFSFLISTDIKKKTITVNSIQNDLRAATTELPQPCPSISKNQEQVRL